MPGRHLNLTVLAALFLAASIALAGERPPNIVFILADDLGSAELGCYGQKKIRTPHIDRMAKEGVRFTQCSSGNAVCAPSRCVLMTGKHPGHAWVRNNKEAKPEGQEPLGEPVVTLPQLLQKQGYATGAFGKWGLGPFGSTGDPLKKGFDRFFGYNCQRHAHNYYPIYLYDNDKRIELRNTVEAANAKLPPEADVNDPKSYSAFSGPDYAPDLIAAQAEQFVRDNRARPFFLYYPVIVPHLALQVPEDSLAEYRGKFDDTPYPGGKGYLPHIAPRAAYAAMVTRMDRDVGRLMSLVAELGLDEHTIFVFTSDNGPTYDGLGGTDSDYFQSSGKLRGKKGSLYEGGVRVPFIVRWKGSIKNGTSKRVIGFEDCLPTLLELAGAKAATPSDCDGISFVPTLRGEKQPERPFLYREFPAYGGQQSVRMGDWKGIRQNLLGKKGAAGAVVTELYNLKDDPNEETDVAGKHPEIIAQIETLMREQRTASEQFPFAALDGN